MLYASKDVSDPYLVIKTIHMERRCSRVINNSLATQYCMTRLFKHKVQGRPNYKVADMRKDLKDEFNLPVNKRKSKRAKSIIIELMEGS